MNEPVFMSNPDGPIFKFVLHPEDNADIVATARENIERHLSDCMAKRYEMIEVLMLTVIAKTGFRPDQLELCEVVSRTEPYTVKWFIRNLADNSKTEADPCHVRIVPTQPQS